MDDQELQARKDAVAELRARLLAARATMNSKRALGKMDADRRAVWFWFQYYIIIIAIFVAVVAVGFVGMRVPLLYLMQLNVDNVVCIGCSLLLATRLAEHQ